MKPMRVGRKVGRTLYREDILIGVMDTRDLAAEVVQAVNAHEELLEACKEARVVLAVGIHANTPGMNFDPAEHVTVKKLDQAIATAEVR